MNISIIIPNYNGEKLLKNNLPKVLDAVKDYKKGFVEIIIPNDPSTDNSSEIIDSFISSIKEKNITGKTISNKNKNEAGFSKNVNRGVSLATGDILILLNSDVYPHKNFLDSLIPHFEDPNVFAVGCMDESIEDNEKILRGRGIADWKKGFFIHSKGDIKEFNTLWASGGSSAFRKTIWNRLKGFDTLYNPFYWEDIDISYRALKSGYRVLFEPKSIVVHEHEKGAIKKKFRQTQIQKIAYRNQFIFIWKNITDLTLILSHIFWLPYHFVNAARRRDLAFFVGFFSALAKYSNIMKTREQAKKLFKISDRIILNAHKQ